MILFLILVYTQLYAQNTVISGFPKGGDRIPKKVKEKLDSLSNNINKEVEITIWGLSDKKTWYPKTQWPEGNCLKDSLIALSRAHKVAEYLRSLGWEKVGISGLKTQTNYRGANLIFKNEKSPKDTITITKKENYWNLSLGYQTLITERISLITPMIKLSFSHQNFSFSLQGGYSPWGRGNHDLFFGPMIHLWSKKNPNPIIGLGFGWELQEKTDFWEKKKFSFLLGGESIIGKINLESGLAIGKSYNYKLKNSWDLGLFFSLGIRIGGE